MQTTHTFYLGHVLDALKTMPSESVHCVVTSPPFWGLRAYGTDPQVWGGDSACEHDWATLGPSPATTRCGPPTAPRRSGPRRRPSPSPKDASAGKCSAWLGELGLEPTPDLYVSHLVEVFREVKRVLRGDGTVWLDMGDSYCSTAPSTWGDSLRQEGIFAGVRERTAEARRKFRPETPPGLKPKDLCGIPWRVAFGLQADGWYLRSDIIWKKLNPMPESVTDRPTRSHEYIFLLTKRERYFYDATAIREEPADYERKGGSAPYLAEGMTTHGIGSNSLHQMNPAGRNKRDVWTIPTEPFPGAHFAVFPEMLVEPCILAGTSEKGCCPKCGAPWTKVVKKQRVSAPWNKCGHNSHRGQQATEEMLSGRKRDHWNDMNMTYDTTTLGWRPTCSCDLAPIPCVVMDPFGGSGTVSVVAQRYGRNSIYIDLKAEYRQMAVDRMRPEQPSLVQPYEIVLKEAAI